MKATVILKGGGGSGHWGHCGVEGQVGGSLPGTICLNRITGRTAGIRKYHKKVSTLISTQRFTSKDEHFQQGVTPLSLIHI